MYKKYWFLAIFFFSFLGITYFIYNPPALYFLNDDLVHIPLSSQNFFFQQHSFRVMHEILITIEYNLFGTNAVGYHYIQYLIHVFCSVLVFIFSYNLCKQYGTLKERDYVLISVLSAAFFSVYAFHSEAILWILGETASLATLFFLLSAITYLKRELGVFYFICSLLFFQVGLFTYESNWVAPVFICLLSWVTVKNKQKLWKTERAYPIIYSATFIVNLIIRKIILGQYGGSYGDNKLFGFNMKNLLYNGICLFVRSFVPPSHPSTYFILFTVILVTLLFFVLRLIRSKKTGDSLMLVLTLSFLASLIPTLTLGISTHSRESERYLYLPSVFLCLLVIYTLFKFSLSSKMLYTTLIALFVYNIFYSYINTRDYAVASTIAKDYYAYFKKEEHNTDTIIVKDFPQQFNGVPLFRLGFKEGLAWLDNIDTSKILIPKDEEMKVSTFYDKSFAKSDYVFSFKENKINSKRAITLFFDTTYFSIADFSKK